MARAASTGGDDLPETRNTLSFRGMTRFYPDFAGRRRLRNRLACNNLYSPGPTCLSWFVDSSAEKGLGVMIQELLDQA
jgi:hypothetical protein